MLQTKETDQIRQWLEKYKLQPAEIKRLIRLLESGHQEKRHSHDFSGKHVKIGVLGDSHFGNRWSDKFLAQDVMRYFKKQKVEAVYFTGDMVDGPWQRHRNVLEQYAFGFDEQVQDFVDDFPDIGIPIYLIDGNHDGWYRKGEGALVGAEIARRRKDIFYLGTDEADVRIGKLEMMLSHPDDGTAYAYSYKAQKFIESLVKMGEKLPNIILQGHYHKIFYMNAANVHYFCTGTTCRQTPWMRGKKIAADMGAWELDIYRNSKGDLTKLSPTLLPYHGEKHKPFFKQINRRSSVIRI